MDVVTVSRKFRIEIPPPVRQALRLAPGSRLQVIPYKDRIEFITIRPARALRGFLRGIDTNVPRDPDHV